MSSSHRRLSLRAPLKTFVLYDDDHFGFKAKAINISVSGLLLENLPHVPEVSALYLLLDLPQFPHFQSLGNEKIKKLDALSFPRKIIRAKSKIIRSFEGQTEVDKIFIQKIGLEFVDLSQEKKDHIESYVTTFTKNIIYLLSLFESGTQTQNEVLYHASKILGYTADKNLANLRQKILHDYQSLEGL